MSKRVSSMQQKRGYKDNMPILKDGELAFCKDTNELFIGKDGENTLINASINVDDSIEYLKFASPNGSIFKMAINDNGEFLITKLEDGGGVNPDPEPEPEESEYKGLIINQIYGGGIANDGGTSVSHSFIELYNTTDKIFNLSKVYIQIFNSNGSEWQIKQLNGFIYPQHSYLIRGEQHSDPALETVKVKVENFDLEWNVLLYNKGLKVLLTESSELLTVPNPFDIDGEGKKSKGYIDMIVACDVSIDAGETQPLLGLSKQKSARRIAFADTDDNSADCEIVDFRNSSSAINSEFHKIPRWLGYGSWLADDKIPEGGGGEEEVDYTGLIINQVYGGGAEGDNGTAVSHSFIELYNKTDKIIDLNGLSVQWSPLGSNWAKLNLVGSIPPRHSFLIRGGQHSDPTLPVVKLNVKNFDLEWNTFIYNKGVKVVLVKGRTLLYDITNPFNIDGSGTKVAGYIDMFGVAGNDPGLSIDGCETDYGTGKETGQSKQKSFRRVEFADTDNNANDFELVDWRLHNEVYNKEPRYLAYGEWDKFDEMPDPYEPVDGVESTYDDSYFEGLIINQFYGGGAYMSDETAVSHSFVELYNNSNHTIDLTNCSLQYSGGGTLWERVVLKGSIPAKTSFLVRGMQHSTYEASVCKLFLDYADQEWNALISNKGAKIALLACTKLIDIENPFDTDGAGAKFNRYIDMIGTYTTDIGDDIDGSEGTAIIGQSKQKSIRRVDFADTNDNSVDCAIIDFREAVNYKYFPRYLDYGVWDESDLELVVTPDESKISNINMTLTNDKKMKIMWESISETATLELLNSPDTPTEQEVTTVANTNMNGAQIYTHSAIMNNNRANYIYNCKITSPTGNKQFSYTMPEDTEEFKFLHVTDTQSANITGYELWGNTVKKAVENSMPKFIIHTGDMVQNATIEDEWRAFFGCAEETLTTVPMFPVLGNNDMETTTESNTFKRILGTTDLYYSFDFGNAHFVVLNSNADMEAQKTWLASDLSGTMKKWKIACIHEAPYMVSVVPLSKELVSTLEAGGVDLVICGHKHDYVRTHRILADTIVETGGIVYVMSNGTGIKTGSVKPTLNWHSVNIESGKPSYVEYSISNDSIVLASKKIVGDEIIDIDNFTMTK